MYLILHEQIKIVGSVPQHTSHFSHKVTIAVSVPQCTSYLKNQIIIVAPLPQHSSHLTHQVKIVASILQYSSFLTIQIKTTVSAPPPPNVAYTSQIKLKLWLQFPNVAHTCLTDIEINCD